MKSFNLKNANKKFKFLPQQLTVISLSTEITKTEINIKVKQKTEISIR